MAVQMPGFVNYKKCRKHSFKLPITDEGKDMGTDSKIVGTETF